MRILSARIARVQHLRNEGEIAASVFVLARLDGHPLPILARVEVRSPAHAPGAAPLRDRLLAAAKLAFIAGRAEARQAA